MRKNCDFILKNILNEVTEILYIERLKIINSMFKVINLCYYLFLNCIIITTGFILLSLFQEKRMYYISDINFCVHRLQRSKP